MPGRYAQILKAPLFILIVLSSLLSCNSLETTPTTSERIIEDTFAIPKDSSTLYFPTIIIDQGKESKWYGNTWYSEMLFALHEPVLANYTGNKEIFRFTWLRSFHNPVAIRIQKLEDDITLIVKVSNGAGGYKPGQIIIDKTIPLSIGDWNNFMHKVEKIDFWNLPLNDPSNLGDDGAEWILEGVTKSKYHFATRWMAGRSEYGDCCKYLLELSKLNVPKEQQY